MTTAVNSPAFRPAPAPAAARPTMVEADASVGVTRDGLLLANGSVKLDHGFMLRLLKHILRSPNTFRGLKLAFDRASGTYTATGRVKVFGIWLPVSAKARPLADANSPAFQFTDVRLMLPGFSHGLGGHWLTRLATREVASAIQDSGIATSADAGRGVVRLSTNGILKAIDGVPSFVRLDPRANRFAVTTSAEGDISLGISSNAQAPAPNRTPHSDLAFDVDPQGLATLLAQVMGDNVGVQRVTMRPGVVSVDVLVNLKPVSDAVNDARALAALVFSPRSLANFEDEKVMGTVTLDVAVKGSQLVIKPSLPQAQDRIAQGLNDAGIPASVKPDGIHADLAPFLADKGISASDVKVTNGHVSARLDVDIDGRIGNPALRGG